MKKLFFFLTLVLLSTNARAQVETGGGFPPFGSFEVGAADTVNRQNLNSNFSIPVYSGSGRGVGLAFNIAYNSLIWQNVSNVWKPVVTTSGALTWGWNTTYVSGAIAYTTSTTNGMCVIDGHDVKWPLITYSNYTYTEPNGTLHSFPITWTTTCTSYDGTTSGYATDDSGYWMNAVPSRNAPVAYTPAGEEITNAIIQDSNGNYVSSTLVNSSETDWLDTFGRHAVKITSGSSSIQYQYQDTTGTYRTITLNLGSFNIKTNFGCSGVVEYSGTASLPTSVSYPNGTSYSISYEATPGHSGYVTGRVSKLTLPNGGYVQYAYGTTNDGTNCPDGTITNLTRTVNDGTNSPVWQFTGAQSGSNWATTITYPKMPYDLVSNQSVYTFNSAGQEISEQIYQAAASGGTLLRTINTTWASNHSPATQIKILEDNTTQSENETTYDNYGNLQVLKEHDFGSGSPGPVLRTTNYTYLTSSAYTNLNIMNRVTAKTIADQSGTVQYQEDTAYDGSSLSPCPTGIPQHNDTAYPCTFTTRGNATSFTTYTNAFAPSGAETKTFSFDIFGNLVQAQDDCCQLIQRTYSAATEYSSPDTVVRGATGGPQLVGTYTYNSYTSQLASIENPNNLVTYYAYDLMRRPLTITRPDNSEISYTYNDSAHTVTNTSPVDSSHSISKTEHQDGLGRVIEGTVTDASQNTYSITQHLYDAIGRSYQQSNPYTSTAQYWTTVQYDALGRNTKTILQDNSPITYTYSAATATTTDSAGHQRKNQSDGLGRVVTFFEPDPTNNNSLTLQTNFTYSVLDEAATIAQGSQSRTFSYDGMGRLISEVHPESGTTGYQYNTYDEVAQRTDNRGVITTYSYDTLNRLWQVSYNVGTTGVPATSTVTYAFGTTPGQYNNGLLLSMADGTGSTTYSYDNMARTTQEAHVVSGTPYTVSYQYNLAGRVTSTTYPSSRVVQQGYDAIGRLASTASGTTTYMSSV
jgi:YD repeat-containing protein